MRKVINILFFALLLGGTAKAQQSAENRESSKKNIEEFQATTDGPIDANIPWASSFLNFIIKESNAKGTNSIRAYSWLEWGTPIDKPAYGCVAVTNYSHVGIVWGINDDGRIIVLAGDQSRDRAVCLLPIHARDIIAYRVPPGTNPNYVLPKYKLRGPSYNFD